MQTIAATQGVAADQLCMLSSSLVAPTAISNDSTSNHVARLGGIRLTTLPTQTRRPDRKVWVSGKACLCCRKAAGRDDYHSIPFGHDSRDVVWECGSNLGEQHPESARLMSVTCLLGTSAAFNGQRCEWSSHHAAPWPPLLQVCRIQGVLGSNGGR